MEGNSPRLGRSRSSPKPEALELLSAEEPLPLVGAGTRLREALGPAAWVLAAAPAAAPAAAARDRLLLLC